MPVDTEPSGLPGIPAQAATPSPLPPRTPFARPVTALASAALIALEITWTRIFAAEFWYTFAFLILSLAVLGMGLGGLCLRLRPRLFRPQGLAPLLLLAALLSLAGPPAVLHLNLDISGIFAKWAMAGRFVLALLLLASAFLTGGLLLSILFRAHHEDMPRLYMADLLGAAAGVLLAVVLMNAVGTPRATFLLALPLSAAAFLCGSRAWRVAALASGAAVLLLLPLAPRLLVRPRKERMELVARHWDALSMVKTFRAPAEEGGVVVMNIDNAAHTRTVHFDGNYEALNQGEERFPFNPRRLMSSLKPDATFLSLGAGGGRDVLMALAAGAREVHAVEVNPYLNHRLTKGDLVDYSGRIYLDTRVKVVTEDARSYVRRHENRFDVIFSLSSNSFAALVSGAFAMAENYLFTVEAFKDYHRALTPRGVLFLDHQRYVPRLLPAALQALRERGVAAPSRHIAVYQMPADKRQLMIMGKEPLTRDLIENAVHELEERDFKLMHRVWPDPEPGADPLCATIMDQGWKAAEAGASIDLSPTTDDRPFAAQLGLWRNFSFRRLADPRATDFNGFPASKVIVATIFAIVALLVLPLNLLPFRNRGPRLGWAGWGYFFCIGVGFMALEVVLMQRYTLFVGSSAYTIAAILFTLLLGSGLGSRFAARVPRWLPFLGILAWLVLELTVLPALRRTLGVHELPLRLLCTVVLLGPLGFLMGMPFPKGTARAGELVDWGFAVNGAAGVLGSCGVLLLSFQWGFTAALLAGGAAYLAAGMLLASGRGWPGSVGS